MLALALLFASSTCAVQQIELDTAKGPVTTFYCADKEDGSNKVVVYPPTQETPQWLVRHFVRDDKEHPDGWVVGSFPLKRDAWTAARAEVSK